MKTCKICKIPKAIGNFYNQRLICKQCYTDTRKEYNSKYRIENLDSIAEKKKLYKQINKENERNYHRQYQRNRLKKDDLFLLKHRINSLIYFSISSRGYTKVSKVANILGCDYTTLKHHLESKFCNGMSWENMGLWHIDHIIPSSSATNEQELLNLNNYLNLQPLWAVDNLRKSNKLIP